MPNAKYNDDLKDDYFEWLCNIVQNKNYFDASLYNRLLSYLHGRSFQAVIEMDSNRALDGMDLRSRFGCESGHHSSEIREALGQKSCSILELMIGLSVRCEDQIMADPDVGNRTGEWFWLMIKNLGLSKQNDANFNRGICDKIINRFLDREYTHDGYGSLFAVHGSEHDFRNAEIWYQMMWFLTDQINKRRI